MWHRELTALEAEGTTEQREQLVRKERAAESYGRLRTALETLEGEGPRLTAALRELEGEADCFRRQREELRPRAEAELRAVRDGAAGSLTTLRAELAQAPPEAAARAAARTASEARTNEAQTLEDMWKPLEAHQATRRKAAEFARASALRIVDLQAETRWHAEEARRRQAHNVSLEYQAQALQQQTAEARQCTAETLEQRQAAAQQQLERVQSEFSSLRATASARFRNEESAAKSEQWVANADLFARLELATRGKATHYVIRMMSHHII